MLETVMIISCVVNVISLFIIFTVFSAVKSKELYISQVHNAVSHALVKLTGLEANMNKLISGVTDVINSYADLMDRMSKYPSMGNLIENKLVSIDEFMDLINDNKKFNNMTSEEIDNLKKMFSDSDMEDDDDFDDEEPFKK